MKLIEVTQLDPVDLHMMLSRDEAQTMGRIVSDRIQKLIYDTPLFQEPQIMFTQSFWLPMPPHYMHFDLEIQIMERRNVGEHPTWRYREKFSGKLDFFTSEDDFIMARELAWLKDFPTYIRYN